MVAVVVPHVDALKGWAYENRIPGTLTVLCNNSRVKELILNDMLNWGKQCGLKSFEQVSDRNTVQMKKTFTIFLCIYYLLHLTGKRHLPASRSIFRAKRSLDTRIEAATATSEKLFQTTTRRHVQSLRLVNQQFVVVILFAL